MLYNKIKSSFILGAIGDALGAPIEGIFNLKSIKEKYGENGLNDLIAFDSHFEIGKSYEAGSITDDTTMAMTTSNALEKTIAENPVKFTKKFLNRLNYYTWQGYINWAQAQTKAEVKNDKLDTHIKWNDLTKRFWIACGAGKGTLAALRQPRHGTLEKPLEFKEEIEGKIVESPNYGCGGMMRIAPVAFIEQFSDEQIFETACQNAAITHGSPDAIVATGITALFVRNATKEISPKEILENTKQTIISYSDNPLFKSGVEKCINTLNYVEKLDVNFNLGQMDSIPTELGYDKKLKFSSIPVLAQVTYAMLNASTADKVKESMIMAANHSGDSDSVAAITGNILGARYDDSQIYNCWSDKLVQKKDIETMAKHLFIAVQSQIKAPSRSL